MTAMISGISLPKASGAQRRAFPAILSPKHLAAAARLAAEIKIHHMPELDSWAVEGCELGWTAAGTSDWGTDCRHAGELLADALNSRAPQIFDTTKVETRDFHEIPPRMTNGFTAESIRGPVNNTEPNTIRMRILLDCPIQRPRDARWLTTGQKEVTPIAHRSRWRRS